MKLEIERKFIVKSLPKIKEDDVHQIEQYYFKNEKGVWERARTYHSDKTGDMYIHTVKKSVSKGVNMEDEYEMTKEQFESFRKKCMSPGIESKHISKERWIYKDGDLKWEVDKFNSGYHLIIAEIEIPNKKYDLKIPKFIEDIMLLEVTGLKQFSNRALSLKIEK
jgi:CYTH domain-containing protein